MCNTAASVSVGICSVMPAFPYIQMMVRLCNSLHCQLKGGAIRPLYSTSVSFIQNSSVKHATLFTPWKDYRSSRKHWSWENWVQDCNLIKNYLIKSDDMFSAILISWVISIWCYGHTNWYHKVLQFDTQSYAGHNNLASRHQASYAVWWCPVSPMLLCSPRS